MTSWIYVIQMLFRNKVLQLVKQLLWFEAFHQSALFQHSLVMLTFVYDICSRSSKSCILRCVFSLGCFVVNILVVLINGKTATKTTIRSRTKNCFASFALVELRLPSATFDCKGRGSCSLIIKRPREGQTYKTCSWTWAKVFWLRLYKLRKSILPFRWKFPAAQRFWQLWIRFAERCLWG